MLRRWVWHAGGIALLAVIAAFFMTHSVQPSRELRTYATATGQRASLLLDDGTHIMLAPQTTLRLIQFNQNVRTVMLDGDAYFEVAPSAHIPFVVQTGATTTRVLGTAFAVRHYADDADVRIAVATGKVIVSTGTRHPAVSVTAGQVASVTDSTPVVKKVDDLDTEIGWLGDRLVFQDAPMSKVLATLKRWYGYEFRVTDSTLIQQSVTIGLSIRSSAAALASLEQILDVNLTVVGDTVTLVPVHRHTESNQRSKHYDVWVPTREIGR
jgi:ferric-dicitrate binding protein FerR (iron transport regulator)